MTSKTLTPYFWSGVILFSGALWAFMIGFLKRLQLYYKQKRRKRWQDRWNPLLKQAASRDNRPSDETDESIDVELSLKSMVDPEDFQPARGELEYLLREWNRFMNRLERAHHAPLIQLAKHVGLPDKAVDMAKDQRDVIRRIQGLMALGYLNQEDNWEIALEAAHSEQPYLSIVGCHTLVRLNPEDGIPILLEKYASMEAFPSSQALSMLKLAPPDTVTEILLDELNREEGIGKTRVAELLEAGEPGKIRPVIHNLLKHADVDHEMTARLLHVLGTFGHPEDESLLIKFTDHDSAPVRIQAVKALGEVGSSDSTVPLTNALGDSNWWVRYRAAQSLVKIPDITLDWLKQTRSDHDDPFARDIMARVMTEQNLI